MTWSATSEVPRPYLARSLGASLAGTVTHCDATHDCSHDGVALTGVVRRIDAAFCVMRALVDDPGGYTHEPVPDSTRLERRQRATRTEDDTDTVEWVGYLVHLDVE